MSKRLKQFLFGIWCLLLIPAITPVLEKWLEENAIRLGSQAMMRNCASGNDRIIGCCAGRSPSPSGWCSRPRAVVHPPHSAQTRHSPFDHPAGLGLKGAIGALDQK
jgi:hypothetical protein